jgi:putative SOS response-associated peptidase YedK
MCSRFQSVRIDHELRHLFRATPQGIPADLNQDVFPGYAAPFIRRPRERDSGDEAVPGREAVVGLFGLLPHWAKDEKLTKSTYNARSETVASKPAFRDAWKTASIASSRRGRSTNPTGAPASTSPPVSPAPMGGR